MAPLVHMLARKLNMSFSARVIRKQHLEAKEVTVCYFSRLGFKVQRLIIGVR